jgi:hypothetical protein
MSGLWLITGIIWLLCGIGGYGIQLNYFQKAYPTIAAENSTADRLFAAIFIPFGAISFFLALVYFSQVSRRKVPLGWML